MGGELIPEMIAGIEVKKSIKYLEMEIDETGSWENNVKRKVEMAKRMAGYVRYMVRGKRLRLELGKTI